MKSSASNIDGLGTVGAALRTVGDALNAELEQRKAKAARAEHGQFATPSEAAATLVGLVDLDAFDGEKRLDVLDAGAGAGSLSIGLVARLIDEQRTGAVRILLVETDHDALPALQKAADVMRKAVASVEELEVHVEISTDDFLSRSTLTRLTASFDVVLMNPPYYKLPQSSDVRLGVADYLGVDCANVYGAFVAAGVSVLRQSGQIAAITPRSFANGLYFRPFRRFITDAALFRRVVLFDRRDRIFRSSSVLQETVIFSLEKRGSRRASRELVTVETRVDHESDPHSSLEAPLESLVDEADPDRFINLPADAETMDLLMRFRRHPLTLDEVGLAVSTGPVVDFRLREFLSDPSVKDAVPLIYPTNVRSGRVAWPVQGKKAQAFVDQPSSRKHLFPNGHYVLIKRFTSKEEARRLVAAVYEPIDGHEYVAFENHLNVIHASRQPLEPEVAEEIAAFLNDEATDAFFRIFSGNTQVNATDLRRMRYPASVLASTNGSPGTKQLRLAYQ